MRWTLLGRGRSAFEGHERSTRSIHGLQEVSVDGWRDRHGPSADRGRVAEFFSAQGINIYILATLKERVAHTGTRIQTPFGIELVGECGEAMHTGDARTNFFRSISRAWGVSRPTVRSSTPATRERYAASAPAWRFASCRLHRDRKMGEHEDRATVVRGFLLIKTP